MRTGDELAAEAQIEAANRRAVEVRAEAAMLVEAIEDRAHSVSSLLEGLCIVRARLDFQVCMGNF